MQKLLLKALFLSTLALFAGCSSFKFPWAYTIVVRQGNIIDKEMLDQLEEGLTRRQVRYILGAPLIEDTFHTDRWDYYFAMRKDEKLLYNYRLSVFFDGDTLTHWDGTTDALRSKKDGLTEEGKSEEEQEIKQQIKDDKKTEQG